MRPRTRTFAVVSMQLHLRLHHQAVVAMELYVLVLVPPSLLHLHRPSGFRVGVSVTVPRHGGEAPVVPFPRSQEST